MRRIGIGAVLLLAACGSDQAADVPGVPSVPGAADALEQIAAAAPGAGQCSARPQDVPPLSSLATWIVGDTPAVSFNGEGIQPTGDFDRITGALLLDDGRIVVADQERVRVFDETGAFLYRFGGKGEGPGEWRGVAWIQYLSGDSLIVADTRNSNRISFFSLDGTLGRTVRLQSGPARTFGAFADGSIVGGVSGFNTAPSDWEVASLLRPALDLLHYGRSGEVLGSLGTWADHESVVVQLNLPARNGRPAEVTMQPLLTIGLQVTAIAVGGEEVYVSTGERLGATVLGMTGDTVGVVEAPYSLTPISAEEIVRASMSLPLGEFVKQGLASASYDRWPEDKTLPAVVDLIVDNEGNLWAMEFSMDLTAPVQWTILRPDGVTVGRVQMPLRFSPIHVGSDFVLGVCRDELDIEHVQLRSLEKQ